MPSNYTGNSTAAEAPSPAPSLGSGDAGDPVGALPADGDSLNVSSVLQALKVPLDWIAYFRRMIHTAAQINNLIGAAIAAAISSAVSMTGQVTTDVGTCADGSKARLVLASGLRIVTCRVYGIPQTVTSTGDVIITYSGASAFPTSIRSFYVFPEETSAPRRIVTTAAYISGANQLTISMAPSATVDGQTFACSVLAIGS